MKGLDRFIKRASETVDLTPTRYVIVKSAPYVKAPLGYYAIHPNKVWVWVKERDKATEFVSQKSAELCALGSALDVYTSYRIEQV